jgi:hypothetical protein
VTDAGGDEDGGAEPRFRLPRKRVDDDFGTDRHLAEEVDEDMTDLLFGDTDGSSDRD